MCQEVPQRIKRKAIIHFMGINHVEGCIYKIKDEKGYNDGFYLRDHRLCFHGPYTTWCEIYKELKGSLEIYILKKEHSL